jgi:hypothetical protein
MHAMEREPGTAGGSLEDRVPVGHVVGIRSVDAPAAALPVPAQRQPAAAEVDACPCLPGPVPPRGITPAQLDLAVLQLRERRGRPAAEQMQGLLRVLDLVVVPPCGDHP